MGVTLIERKGGGEREGGREEGKEGEDCSRVLALAPHSQSAQKSAVYTALSALDSFTIVQRN